MGKRACGMLVLGTAVLTGVPALGADLCTGRLYSTSGTFHRRSDSAAVTGAGCGALAQDSANDGVRYQVFRVMTGPLPGALTLSVTSLAGAGSLFDPFVAVHCVPFNPAAPGTNLVAVNDDGLGYPNAGFVAGAGPVLPANTAYDVVVCAYSGYPGSDTGRFQLSVGGLATIVCCAADFNGSGAVSVQDILDFLSAYFAGSPVADFNGVGGVTLQDLFDFIGAYFVPCV